MKDETLRTAFQSWEVMAYEARLKRVLDEEAAVREAELRAQEAEKRGEQRGQEKAYEALACRLLAKGMSTEEVAELTELDEEYVIKIQQHMKN